MHCFPFSKTLSLRRLSGVFLSITTGETPNTEVADSESLIFLFGEKNLNLLPSPVKALKKKTKLC